MRPVGATAATDACARDYASLTLCKRRVGPLRSTTRPASQLGKTSSAVIPWLHFFPVVCFIVDRQHVTATARSSVRVSLAINEWYGWSSCIKEGKVGQPLSSMDAGCQCPVPSPPSRPFQLHDWFYNLGNFLRDASDAEDRAPGSLTSLRESREVRSRSAPRSSVTLPPT